MTASKLGQQTGGDTTSNFEEAKRIFELGLLSHSDDMKPNEREFVEKMHAQVEEGKWALSGRQLFWLRDLKDTYCI